MQNLHACFQYQSASLAALFYLVEASTALLLPRYHAKLTVNFAPRYNDHIAKEKYLEKRKVDEMYEDVRRVRQKLKEAGELIQFEHVPILKAWVKEFTLFLARYTLLILLGPSRSGKTEAALDLFPAGKALEMRVGDSLFFPDAMRRFEKSTHKAVILDDVRDLDLVRKQQDVLQSSNIVCEFGKSPTGQNAYFRHVHNVAFVVTINFTTKNLDFLRTCDFCKHERNCLVVAWPPLSVANAINAKSPGAVREFSFPEGFAEANPDLHAHLLTRFAEPSAASLPWRRS